MGSDRATNKLPWGARSIPIARRSDVDLLINIYSILLLLQKCET